MAILNVLTYPNPELKKVSKPVTSFSEDLGTFAQDMIDTMYGFSGIGLAAPQVGRLERLIVVDTRPKDGGRYLIDDLTDLEKKLTFPLVLVNPEIIYKRGETRYQEGCLSVPSYYEWVDRFEYVEVKATDVDGNEIEIKTDGLTSICIQHEIDHLDGKLFIDRLSVAKSGKLRKQIKKNGYPERKSADELETEEVPT